MSGTKLLIASVAILVATTGQVQAGVVVNIYQDGANVTAAWDSGFLDLEGASSNQPYPWDEEKNHLYHGIADLNGVAKFDDAPYPLYFQTSSFVQSAGWTSGAGYSRVDVTTGGHLLAVWVARHISKNQCKIILISVRASSGI